MRLGARFSALVNRFEGTVYVAVSGGSDSLALLVLAKAWADQAGRSLTALTVDHRLRPESADEAAAVAKLCATLGCAHQTLLWDAPRAQQAAARNARYRLMAEAIRGDRAAILLTGHTLDDVVETALIRRRRGVRGPELAGPTLAAPLPLWPVSNPVTLLRPLIRTTRRDLQHWLHAQDVPWANDPSNQNPAYERVRMRQFLDRQTSLNSLARDAVCRKQEERAAADAALAKALAQVSISDEGLIRVHHADLSTRLLSLLIRCASGGDRDVRAGATVEALRALQHPGDRTTLGGAWLQRSPEGLLIGRDPGADIGVDRLGGFDGRYEKAADAVLAAPEEMPFLLRHARPDGDHWRETISRRLAHMAQCLATPFCNPVEE